MEVNFRSLPFPVKEYQRPRLRSYKAAAVSKESMQLAKRRSLLNKQTIPATKKCPPTHVLSIITKPITHKTSSKPQKDPCVIIGAVVRGFLTRRLFYSEKVQSIVKTIKDSSLVLSELTRTANDETLYQRVFTQLQVARLTLHEIFFELPAEEQMTYIAHSRSLREDRSLRTTTVIEVKDKQGKLSAATMKARQRRQQQQQKQRTLRKH